jgi:hypothetical protein
MDRHPLRLARGLPLPSADLEIADQFLLRRVDRDHRLPGGHERGRGDVLELRIPIRMRRAIR